MWDATSKNLCLTVEPGCTPRSKPFMIFYDEKVKSQVVKVGEILILVHDPGDSKRN